MRLELRGSGSRRYLYPGILYRYAVSGDTLLRVHGGRHFEGFHLASRIQPSGDTRQTALDYEAMLECSDRYLFVTLHACCGRRP